jgi:hypothetical protein
MLQYPVQLSNGDFSRFDGDAGKDFIVGTLACFKLKGKMKEQKEN